MPKTRADGGWEGFLFRLHQGSGWSRAAPEQGFRRNLSRDWTCSLAGPRTGMPPVLTPGTHVPRVGSAWGLGTDSIPPGPRWVEWELRARWLHCPHIYPLHTFGVPRKTAQVKERWQHHPRHLSKYLPELSPGLNMGEEGVSDQPALGLLSELQRALALTGIYACCAHVCMCVFRTHVFPGHTCVCPHSCARFSTALLYLAGSASLSLGLLLQVCSSKGLGLLCPSLKSSKGRARHCRE